MEKTLLEHLNGIFGALSAGAGKLTKTLQEEGLSAFWGWYAFHSVKVEGEYVTEEFPIPVVTAGEVCDVGFDLDQIFVELRLPRERALDLDYRKLAPGAEVYGAEEFLEDFYHEGMELGKICGRIRESGETTVCIAGTFPAGTDTQTLARAVRKALACVGGKGEARGTAG